jgi:hypothetical protein
MEIKIVTIEPYENFMLVEIDKKLYGDRILSVNSLGKYPSDDRVFCLLITLWHRSGGIYDISSTIAIEELSSSRVLICVQGKDEGTLFDLNRTEKLSNKEYDELYGSRREWTVLSGNRKITSVCHAQSISVGSLLAQEIKDLVI